MSRLRVRRFLPVLIAFVIAALALLAFTQPWQASSVSAGVEDAAPPQFVPAAYVATETAAAPAEAKVQTPPVVSPQGTPTTAEPIAPANSLVHPARAGEAVTAIARMYLPQTPYMSTHELEAAIRRANPEIKGQFLKAGTQVIVPDIEPQPVVATLNREVVSILRTPETRETFLKQGVEAAPSTPEELGDWVKSELVRWTPIIQNAGIKAD